MARNGSISSTKAFRYNESESYTVILDWELLSQDVLTNASTIKVTYSLSSTINVNFNTNSSSIHSIYLEATYGNNEKVNTIHTIESGTSFSIPANTTVPICSVELIIPHSSVDYMPFTLKGSATNMNFVHAERGDIIDSPLFTSSYSVTGDFILDYIVRGASITGILVNGVPYKELSAADINDECTFAITYSNPAGDYAEELQACISFTGGNDDIPYRNIVKTGTVYTFYLTEEEKATLWTKLDEGLTSVTVRFYIRSRVPVIDGSTTETTWDYLPLNIQFVNYTPIFNPVVQDMNSDTLRLTGDSQILVRYMSEAYFDTGATPRKGATIVSQYIQNGDTTISDTSTGSFPSVTSNTFYLGMTDSRGYSERDFVVFNGANFIEYVKPTCAIKNTPVDANGDATIYVSGKYFEGNFGAAPNKMFIDYLIYKVDEEPGNWISKGFVEPTVDENNDYKYTFTISGLDYKSRYELQVRVGDELNTSETIAKTVLAAEPLFDWSAEDFNFNIPVAMNGGYMYPQWLLWGNPDATLFSQLGAGEEITLDKPISSMPTGAVLVFSLHRDTVEDVSLHSFFISRTEVQLFPGKKHTFMMGINSNLSVFGAKYVTIEDTKLTGNSGNESAGTAACGITFDNTKFVLRYVIGV